MPTSALFSSPFYPNQTLEMVEVGDLGKGTPYAVPRPVVFITDAYGYRNTPRQIAPYDIVVVGDSMAAGSSLTQTDTVTAVLADRSAMNIYNYAPDTLSSFLADTRFQAAPPRTVIFQIIERSMATDFCSEDGSRAASRASPNPNADHSNMVLDLWMRNVFYGTAFIKANFAQPDKALIVSEQRMLFYELSLESPESSTANIERVTANVKRCQTWLADRGIDFIFLPIPDKENVFFDEIPVEARPAVSSAERRAFLTNVIEAARSNGIPTIDLLTAFIQAREAGIIPYQLDDTHWNPTGITIAVEELLPLLEAR